MQVDPAVRFPRDGGAHHVHDPEHRGGPGGAGGAHRLERVRRLARLGDRHRDQAGLVEGAAVAVLRRILDLDRDARELLEQVAPDQAGMPRGPARHDHDPSDRGALLPAQVEAVEPGPARVEQQPAPQGAAHRLGLFADLLQHEVRVAVQLDALQVPGDVVDGAQLHVILGVDDVIPRRGEHRDVAVVEIHDGAGMLQDRRGVGGDEQLALRDPQEHRRALPRDDHLAGIVGGHHREAVGPDHVRERGDDLRLERLSAGVLDQVRQRLRIGLGAETVAARLEGGAQRIGVLDDAVVDEREATGAVHVRMGVAGRGRAVRGPAGVRDARRAVHRLALEGLAQSLDPSGELAHGDAGAAPVHHRHPGGVVAAVLEPPQPFQQDGHGLARAHVADDAAHASAPLGAVRGRV